MSTATLSQEAAPPSAPSPRATANPMTDQGGARRTLVALLACALAILPLKQVFSDWSWLLPAWTGMAVVLLPAAALRMRYRPNVIQLGPGIVLGVIYLTISFVPTHAVFGIIPADGAWSDVGTLLSGFRDSVRDGVAPIHSTSGVRLVLTTQVMLFAIAVDLLATVAHRPALVGVPMLFMLVVADAIPRRSVNLLWFIAIAVAYLILLASGAREELARWGRALPQKGAVTGSRRIGLSGRQIGVIALVVALCVPLLLPVRSVNLIANALHNGGTGGGGSVTISAFAGLQGNLTKTTPVNLFSVDVSGDASAEPFYLRQRVLDTYNSKGWVASSDGGLTPLSGSFGSQLPNETQLSDSKYTATITISHLAGNAPVFQYPTAISGLSGRFGWSPKNLLTVGNALKAGTTYTEQVDEPRPTVEQIRADAAPVPSAQLQEWLKLPDVPSQVHTLVTGLTANAGDNYAKAMAILDYFLSPNSGFTYSLETKAGDSGSDLVDFLNNKTGFCQQYAAAMAVMLRLANVPARVVIGYTHSAPDKNGHFEVTTNDAHAWVEAYFPSVGWIPFDPTPLGGVDAARASVLPWALHPSAADVTATAGGGNPTAQDSVSAAHPTTVISGSSAQVAAGPVSHLWTGWQFWTILAGILALLVVLLSPALTRLVRRRHRLRGPDGRPDPIWAELADTADDLGYVWSPARSPRQVLSWLSDEGLPEPATRSLQTITRAVESARYAEVGTGARPIGSVAGIDHGDEPLVEDLREVERALRARRSAGQRLHARLLPTSVHWVGRLAWWR